MIQSLIYIIIIGFILGLLYFAVDWIGTKFGAPDVIRNVLKGIIVLVGLIFLINFLLVLAGQPGFIRLK